MSKPLIILLIFVILILALLSARFIFGGPEDTWLCENGTWTEHGHPSTPQPETPCNS